MKCSLIYFDANQLEDYLLNETYRKAYDDLISEEPVFIWTGRRTENQDFLVIDEAGELCEIKKEDVYLILVRGKNMPEVNHCRVINSKKISDTFDNKLESKALVPKKNRINVYTQLNQLVRGGKYVVKPVDGLKGDGILISSDPDAIELHYKKLKKLDPDKPVVIEDFIKAKPLNGLEVYDIRLIVVYGKFCNVSVRTPAKGSELCNVAKGGNIKIYNSLYDLPFEDPDHVYDQLTNIMTRVTNRFENRNLIYSVDFTVDMLNNVKVFEFNSYPGIRLEYTSYMNELKNILHFKNLFIARKRKINYVPNL